MMEDTVWGDHLEIMAFSKMYKVPVVIYDENHTQPQQGGEFDMGDGRKACGKQCRACPNHVAGWTRRILRAVHQPSVIV